MADIDDDQRPTADEDAEWDRKATAEDPRYPARKAVSEALDKYVLEWIDGYELDDGEVSHSPNELEKFLIYDAFAGLTGDEEYQRLHAAWQALCPTPEEKLYRATLRAVERLVAADPAVGSAEGQLLGQLSAAIEQYERVKFPIASSTAGGVPSHSEASDGACNSTVGKERARGSNG